MIDDTAINAFNDDWNTQFIEYLQSNRRTPFLIDLRRALLAYENAKRLSHDPTQHLIEEDKQKERMEYWSYCMHQAAEAILARVKAEEGLAADRSREVQCSCTLRGDTHD